MYQFYISVNHYELRLIEDYMLVTGQGYRDDVVDFISGVDLLYDLATKNNIFKMLADYRDVSFNVNSVPANLLNQFKPVNDPWKLRIATVINEENLGLKNLWLKIAERKNYTSAVFIDMESAKLWLKQVDQR